MSRRFISDLCEREEIDEIYLASEKQLRPNRNGNLYLQVRLSDRSGTVNAMMWNATDRHYEAFENGDYVRVQGTSQLYNGNMQIILTQVDVASEQQIDEEDFVLLSEQRRSTMLRSLAQTLRAMDDVHLKSLAECFLMDEDFIEQFSQAPAGIKNHHAYAGGLLEHVHSLISSIELICSHYVQLNRDMLLMGGFLHDVGKIEELSYDRALGYSDAGQLVGHLVQGVSILERKLAEVEKLTGEPFPARLAVQLKHMIVSHHGRLEFGSPKVPMTLEAVALHYLDDLDAKLYGFEQLMREDANPDSPWTVYHPQLGRKLFKSDAMDEGIATGLSGPRD